MQGITGAASADPILAAAAAGAPGSSRHNATQQQTKDRLTMPELSALIAAIFKRCVGIMETALT